jgi:predicted nucleic acid-binding Zn finger protein
MAQTVSQSRPAAVQAVLNRSHQWVSARRKLDGQPFFFVPGHTNGAVYMTSDQACTCPSAQHRSGPCKHVAAVRAHQARQTAQTTPAPKPAPKLRGYHELFGPDED